MRADVLIVGAGPVGLAFARALGGSGLSIALIERQSEATLRDPADDGREIALTHRSIRSLRQLGAWSRIPPAEVSPLRGARVLNEGAQRGLRFDAGYSHRDLGVLVPNHAIRRALFDSVAGQPDVTFVTGALASVETGTSEIAVVLQDGRRIAGRLLVAADSRLSAARAMLGIGSDVHHLQRAMLVCRVRHPGDHDGIATEWFDRRHTIAMLPLNDGHSSVVLTASIAEIGALAELSPARLSVELTRRFRGRLGAMTIVGGVHVYPLVTTFAHRFAASRAALIGDAAVGMHPVTAHGFNFGLQGQDRLADLVRAAARRGGDIAAPALLERYARDHRRATRPLYTATNLIAGLYADSRPVARLARRVLIEASRRLPLVQRGVSTMRLHG
uniref:5-demethoxyubiquinol-8 5-hydroxylase UbiM n=1 Tax=uncultured Sphingomonas sp. TaxID=158754 RepID=UPI0035CB5A76